MFLVVVLALSVVYFAWWLFLSPKKGDNSNSSTGKNNSLAIKNGSKKSLLDNIYNFRRKILLPANSRAKLYTESNPIDMNNLILSINSVYLQFLFRNCVKSFTLQATMEKLQLDKSQVFSALEEVFDIYIIFRANSISDKEIFTKIITENLLPFYQHNHRILFYSSNISKQAFVRQIEPVVHFEFDDSDFSSVIHPFVPVIFTAELPVLSASQKQNRHLLLQLDDLSDIVHVDLNNVTI